MNYALRLLSLVIPVVLSSCRGDRQDEAFNDYAARYLRAQHDYCSTNILVAEKGLLEFRRWLLSSEQAGEPWYSHDLNMLHVDGRLFLLYEHQGLTNKAEQFFQEGRESYLKFLRNQHRPEETLSKDQLRERLASQERDLEVGWQK